MCHDGTGSVAAPARPARPREGGKRYGVPVAPDPAARPAAKGRKIVRRPPISRWALEPVTWDHLESLHLLGPRVSDEWLRWLREHAPSGTPAPAVVEKAKEPPSPSLYERLKGFGLRGTSVSDAALSHLVVFKHLKHLAIVDSPNITAEGIQRLKALPNLEELHLAGVQFADATLTALRDLPQLRVLVLDFSPVTEKGLKALEGLDHLEFLSLVRTRVPAEAAKEWQRAHPQVRTVRTERHDTTYILQGWILEDTYGLWDDCCFAPGSEER